MGYRKTNFVEGEYYHIYNRGNSKQKIFFDDYDRDRFTKLLYLCNSDKNVDFREDIVRKKIEAWDFNRGERLVSIGAWVLMDNHFHLYLTINPNKNSKKILFRGNEISEFLHKILTSYSKYINTKYKRVGSLFENKFKDTHINNNNYAKYLFSYIHLNPVKLVNSKWKESGIKDLKKIQDFLKKYKWSSYLDFKQVDRVQRKILNIEDFPEYFHNIEDFDKEILEWLNFTDSAEDGLPQN